MDERLLLIAKWAEAADKEYRHAFEQQQAAYAAYERIQKDVQQKMAVRENLNRMVELLQPPTGADEIPF